MTAAYLPLLGLRLGLVFLLYLFVLWVVRSLWRDLRAPIGAAPPPQTWTARLVALSASGAEVSDWPLRTVSTVGRADDNTIILPNEFVSAHHAVLRLQKNGWWLQDLGSTNGTWVNDQRVASLVQVRKGDIVRFGSLAARFEA